MNLTKISKHFGSDAALARALGVSRSCIYQWHVRRAIPAARQFQIQVLSGGRFKAGK